MPEVRNRNPPGTIHRFRTDYFRTSTSWAALRGKADVTSHRALSRGPHPLSLPESWAVDHSDFSFRWRLAHITLAWKLLGQLVFLRLTRTHLSRCSSGPSRRPTPRLEVYLVQLLQKHQPTAPSRWHKGATQSTAGRRWAGRHPFCQVRPVCTIKRGSTFPLRFTLLRVTEFRKFDRRRGL